MCSVLNQFLSTFHISKVNFTTQHTKINEKICFTFLPGEILNGEGSMRWRRRAWFPFLREGRERETQRRSERKLERTEVGAGGQHKVGAELNTRGEVEGENWEPCQRPATWQGLPRQDSLQLRAVPSASF